MKISGHWLRRLVAGCLVMFLAVPLGEAAMVRPQQALPAQHTEGASSSQVPPQNSDNTTNQAPTDTGQSAVLPDDPASVHSQTADQSGTSSSAPEQQQNGTSPSVGTAAAPYEKTMGIAASRPAGAAIAAAKQKRTRSFLIRVGLILGAAAAVGTVVALTKASPSRPN